MTKGTVKPVIECFIPGPEIDMGPVAFIVKQGIDVVLNREYDLIALRAVNSKYRFAQRSVPEDRQMDCLMVGA